MYYLGTNEALNGMFGGTKQLLDVEQDLNEMWKIGEFGIGDVYIGDWGNAPQIRFGFSREKEKAKE